MIVAQVLLVLLRRFPELNYGTAVSRWLHETHSRRAPPSLALIQRSLHK